MFPASEVGTFIEGGRAYRVATAFPPRALGNVLQSEDGYHVQVSPWGTGTAAFQFAEGEANHVVNADRKRLCCSRGAGEIWTVTIENPGEHPQRISLVSAVNLSLTAESRRSTSWSRESRRDSCAEARCWPNCARARLRSS